jgi:FtsZ-interacting cell division protein YlmF
LQTSWTGTLDEELRKREERNRQQRKRRAEQTSEQREENNRKQRESRAKLSSKQRDEINRKQQEYRARKKAASQNISNSGVVSQELPTSSPIVGTESLHYFHLQLLISFTLINPHSYVKVPR